MRFVTLSPEDVLRNASEHVDFRAGFNGPDEGTFIEAERSPRTNETEQRERIEALLWTQTDRATTLQAQMQQ